MPRKSPVDGVEDATHELLSEIARWLRYNPAWSGQAKLSAGIQRGIFTSTDIELRRVRHARQKTIPEGVDKAKTTHEALQALQKRMRLQAERAISYNSELYGTLSAVAHFRQGVLIRADVGISDTQLSKLLKF